MELVLLQIVATAVLLVSHLGVIIWNRFANAV